MADLVSLSGGLANRESRRAKREIEQLGCQARVEVARIGLGAELQAERVSAVAYVGKRAMHEITMVSQLEVQLSMLVPSATSRLQGIGDLTALAMADVVAETVRRVK